MDRRDALWALLALGGSPALGQLPARITRIGYLGVTSAARHATSLAAFRAGLRDLGYVEGNNLIIEFRWAENNYDRLPALAVELASLNVAVIVTHSDGGARAAAQATATIPIVVAAFGDATSVGRVASLARPGGNMTGLTFFSPEINAKRLEVLKEAFPRIRTIGVLSISGRQGTTGPTIEAAAKSLKLELQQFELKGPNEFESAFTAMTQRGIKAASIVDNPILINNAAAVAGIAVAHRIPTIGFVEFAEEGGLLAYGVNFPAMFRRAAVFVDRILKGTKPGDLPIEQATKFDLIVNKKTATALGLTIPQALLLRADKVIE